MTIHFNHLWKERDHKNNNSKVEEYNLLLIKYFLLTITCKQFNKYDPVGEIVFNESGKLSSVKNGISRTACEIYELKIFNLLCLSQY